MKSLKKLLIPAIVMVTLIIGVVIYYVVNSKKPQAVVIENVDVLTVSPIDVKSVTVTSKLNPDLTVVVNQVMDVDGSYHYDYAGSDVEPGVDFSQNNLKLFTSVLTSYVANNLVSSEGNYSEYGLDNPEYTINIESYSGNNHVVYFGDDTYDGNKCYFYVDDSKDIYTTTVIKKSYAGYSIIDFLEAQILNVDYNQLASVRFERKIDGINIFATCEVYESNEPQYFIKEPYVIQASSYFENLMEYICTLQITKFVEISDEDIALYGLDDPAYTFTLKMNSGKETVIHLTSNIGGFYYGYIDGIDNYFQISEFQIEGLDTPILTLINSYIYYSKASDVSAISCDYDNVSFEFEMDVEENTSISADTSTVTVNGRNAKIFNSQGRSYCAVLYEALATIEIGGIDTEVHPTLVNPVATVTYYTSKHQTFKYQFVQRSSDSYYVFLDGEYTCFYVYGDQLFKDGGADTYNYGILPAFTLLDTAIKENINGIYDIPA